jgi:hypothetical protein
MGMFENESTTGVFRTGRRSIAAVAPLTLFHTSQALAEPSIQAGRAFFERDLMLLGVAIVTLLIFNMLRSHADEVRVRPIGRRITDLAKLRPRIMVDNSANNDVIPFAYTDWEPVCQDHFWVYVPEKLSHWRISAFSVARLNAGERYESTKEGLFLFARDKNEIERIISPLQRKIVSRYRSQFSSVAVMHLTPPTHEKESYTWLPSDVATWNAIIGFLDECLAISDSLNCDPQLTICRGLCFWIEVEWPSHIAANWIHRIQAENPELEVTAEEGSMGLRLHIAFPQSLIPRAAQAALEKSA